MEPGDRIDSLDVAMKQVQKAMDHLHLDPGGTEKEYCSFDGE